VRNNAGNTPLHVAMRHNNVDMVQALLVAHADHTIHNTRNQTPFDVACEYGHTAIIDMLSRERIIPDILHDQELFQHLHAQGRNVPAIGMPEAIIARIAHFLPNPNPNSNG
jgi:ankyrin repeat protein